MVITLDILYISCTYAVKFVVIIIDIYVADLVVVVIANKAIILHQRYCKCHAISPSHTSLF